MPERLTTLMAAGSTDLMRAGSATGERWTASDAALACGPYVSKYGDVVKLGKREAYAFRYRWARDDSVRRLLWGYLLIQAVDMKSREGWPATVKRLTDDGQTSDQKYLEDLCSLALLEEHEWYTIRIGFRWPDIMRVYPRIWIRQLSPRYEAIRLYLDIWCEAARHHMLRNLRRS